MSPRTTTTPKWTLASVALRDAFTVRRGKGRISRIGATTRRALLAYRRTLADRGGAVFQTTTGAHLMGSGLRQIYRRLSERTGIPTSLIRIPLMMTSAWDDRSPSHWLRHRAARSAWRVLWERAVL